LLLELVDHDEQLSASDGDWQCCDWHAQLEGTLEQSSVGTQL